MKDKNFGHKIFARVKPKDDIRPYDGDDAEFAYGDLADDAKISIDSGEKNSDGGRDYVKSFVDILKNRVSKQTEPTHTDEQSEEDIDNADEQAEAAFDYFRGISRKIENLKKSVSDAVKTSEAGKIVPGGNLGKYMEDVNERLEEINNLLDERMNQLSINTGDIKNEFTALDERTSGKYEQISQGIENVTKTTEENSGRINELSNAVDGVKERVNEIHTTTNSFDKLYDSVFEFKMAISQMKENVEKLANSQKSLFTFCLVMLILSVVISSAGLAVGIISLID